MHAGGRMIELRHPLVHLTPDLLRTHEKYRRTKHHHDHTVEHERSAHVVRRGSGRRRAQGVFRYAQNDIKNTTLDLDRGG